jgi:hypothetical protein
MHSGSEPGHMARNGPLRYSRAWTAGMLSLQKNSIPTVEYPRLATYIPRQKEAFMSGMKSAYELAMERMGGEADELTNAQKIAIAEIDSKMKAKLAETEIMFDQQLASETDPAKASLLQQTRQEQLAKIKENSEAEKERMRSNP